MAWLVVNTKAVVPLTAYAGGGGGGGVAIEGGVYTPGGIVCVGGLRPASGELLINPRCLAEG